jgi:hypothetical protein
LDSLDVPEQLRERPVNQPLVMPSPGRVQIAGAGQVRKDAHQIRRRRQEICGNQIRRIGDWQGSHRVIPPTRTKALRITLSTISISPITILND